MSIVSDSFNSTLIGWKKHILHIQLVQGPTKISGGGYKNTNRPNLNHMKESLSAINTIRLSVALGYQARLTVLNSPIRKVFRRKNPPAANDRLPRWKRNHLLSTIVMQGCHLVYHSLPPTRNRQGLQHWLRNTGDSDRYSNVHKKWDKW